MKPNDDPAAPEPEETPQLSGALGSGVLFCENCGEETSHRILRLKPTSGASPLSITGVARCRVCRWTHPFQSAREPQVDMALIVSDGQRSERRRVSLLRSRTVRVDEPLPDTEETFRVTKIDTTEGRSVGSAPAPKVATVWAVRGNEAIVPVSIVQGARTTARVLRLPPTARLEIGGTLDVGDDRVVIVGLRARGRTWRLEGDGFEAAEVKRVYGRRKLSPPAGRRVWRTERDMPRSRESSTSLAARSRSSPGVRRTDTVPRASTAERGATVQRSSPS